MRLLQRRGASGASIRQTRNRGASWCVSVSGAMGEYRHAAGRNGNITILRLACSRINQNGRGPLRRLASTAENGKTSGTYKNRGTGAFTQGETAQTVRRLGSYCAYLLSMHSIL